MNLVKLNFPRIPDFGLSGSESQGINFFADQVLLKTLIGIHEFAGLEFGSGNEKKFFML